MEIYKREKYLERIRPFYNVDIIKVITGIRRCGKSFLMRSILEELASSGVPDKDLIFIDLDEKKYRKVRSVDSLEALLDSRIDDGAFKYIFIDEIQNVKGFEELVNAYNTGGNVSVFITGSNSYLLSGELATKLTGRYMEFEIFTLDFSEYMGMKRFRNIPIGREEEEFLNYILNGGFPKSLEMPDADSSREYTKAVVNEIFEKDIRRNEKIRNTGTFETIQKYVIGNFGSTFSVTSVFNYMNKEDRTPVSKETIKRYLDILVSAKIIHRCGSFDVKSKSVMKNEQKYYLADLSIYFALSTDNRINYGPVLENIVYTYLRSKGYELSVGRIGKLECDFIARKGFDSYFYIQVCMTLMERETEEREYRPFRYIRENYPRYIFSLDTLLQRRDGVRNVNLISFLSESSLL